MYEGVLLNVNDKVKQRVEYVRRNNFLVSFKMKSIDEGKLKKPASKKKDA